MEHSVDCWHFISVARYKTYRFSVSLDLDRGTTNPQHGLAQVVSGRRIVPPLILLHNRDSKMQ